MNQRTQMLAAWCGPAAILLFVIGLWGFAGWVPPPPPDATAQQVANMYRNDHDSIRAGMAIMMLAAALIGPFVAVISIQMRRIEGEHSPLSSIQRSMGVFGIIVVLLPPMLWQVAVFRPDRNPEIILAIHDAGWLFFVGVISLFMVQCGGIALCILNDKDQTVFPRWVGYFNVWAALLLLPALAIYFQKTGPFAWNGILVFWVGLGVLGSWYIVMFIALQRAIQNQYSTLAG